MVSSYLGLPLPQVPYISCVIQNQLRETEGDGQQARKQLNTGHSDDSEIVTCGVSVTVPVTHNNNNL